MSCRTIGEIRALILNYAPVGSWFVLERWISDSPFRHAAGSGQSDLDVATGSGAKEILEQHWDTWIVDTDWEWLAEKGINTVRIPVRLSLHLYLVLYLVISAVCRWQSDRLSYLSTANSLRLQIGYYHICGVDPSVLDGTDFANLGHIFAGAWSRVTSALARAHRSGIAVLFGESPRPRARTLPRQRLTQSPQICTLRRGNRTRTRTRGRPRPRHSLRTRRIWPTPCASSPRSSPI